MHATKKMILYSLIEVRKRRIYKWDFLTERKQQHQQWKKKR